MRRRLVLTLAALVLILTLSMLMAGCGSSSTGSGSNGHTSSPAPTVQLSASPGTIAAGQSSTLSWSSTNATSVSISPAISQAALATSGSQAVSPRSATTYTITATGAGGSATATATVTVMPTVTIKVTPTSINSGQSALLQWTSTNATSVIITPNVLIDEQPSLPLNGSVSVQPTQNTTYNITATGPGGTASASATLNYTQVPPTVQLSVNPQSIKQGGSATLSWTTTNASTLLITDQNINQVPLGGSIQFGSATINPSVTSTYTATATNSVGNATATVKLNVTPNFSATLTATPNFIQAGGQATLNYLVTTDPGQTITALTIDKGAPAPSLTGNGSVNVTPAATTTYTLTATESNGLTTTATATVAVGGGLGQNIQHIVVLVQGGHSFDNYFGKLGVYKANKNLPGVTNDIDGITNSSDPKFTIPDGQGNPHNPYHLQTTCVDEQRDAWNEAHKNVNKQSDGSYKMDRFLITGALSNPQRDPLGLHVLGHFDQTDIPYYYELGAQFATSDRWFAPVLADEVPNRMFLFAGTSYGTTYSGASTTAGAFQQPTIFNKLTAANISWRYYTQDATNFLAKYSTTTPAEFANVRPVSEYFSLLAGTPVDGDTSLAQVVFIERGGDVADTDEYSDPGKSIQSGARTVSQMMNALMASPSYWPTSVFFLTYDDNDGLYDHVPPQATVAPDAQPPSTQGPIGVTVAPGDFTTTGLRVPLLVVSPWAKAHYNSKVVRDTTALLKFIETRFNLTPLTARDAAQDDMTEMFDFANAPAFLVPPSLPQQPVNVTGCNEANETDTSHP